MFKEPILNEEELLRALETVYDEDSLMKFETEFTLYSLQSEELAWLANLYEPTSLKYIPKIMKILQVGPGKIFYDLGSGDGRNVIAAAMMGAYAIGVELNEFLFNGSRKFIEKVPNIKERIEIRKGNIFTDKIEGLENADAVCLYLTQWICDSKFPLKLKKRLKNGCLVGSFDYSIDHFKDYFVDAYPMEQFHSRLTHDVMFYLYQIKK